MTQPRAAAPDIDICDFTFFWLRGQDLLKALPLKNGYKGVAVVEFEPTTFSF